ncbi:MAG: DUF2442 domain-containing protein [Treponema sp.]|nr:DUF2442 domain-containing protein [Candidatus Treponema equifaecale]
MLHVENAEYLENYKLKISFNDGKIRIVDLENVIKNDNREIIKALQSIEVFKNFTISHHTVSWKNGLDFAPEFLKELAISVQNQTA